MVSFLVPALLAFYIGVLLGFHPIIAVGGVAMMSVIRATWLAIVLAEDE